MAELGREPTLRDLARDISETGRIGPYLLIQAMAVGLITLKSPHLITFNRLPADVQQSVDAGECWVRDDPQLESQAEAKAA